MSFIHACNGSVISQSLAGDGKSFSPRENQRLPCPVPTPGPPAAAPLHLTSQLSHCLTVDVGTHMQAPFSLGWRMKYIQSASDSTTLSGHLFYAWHFTYICFLPPQEVGFFIGMEGSERPSGLPKVTQRGSGRLEQRSKGLQILPPPPS